MAEIKTTKYTCDISKCKNVAIHTRKKIQVIMKTEQTEGRSVTPYLDFQVIDLCDKCMDKLLMGVSIFGWGAMGFNTYEFSKLDLLLDLKKDDKN